MPSESFQKEFTAMALILASTTPRQVLLLQSRKHNLWMPPGGHVEPHENPFEAAVREALEEAGIDITPYLPRPTRYDQNRIEIPLPFRVVEIRLTHGRKEHYHIDCMYRVEVPDALRAKRDDAETSAIGWFTLSQLAHLDVPADLLPVIEEELKG